MNIASNPSLCYDNVSGECTIDPFPAKRVLLANGRDVSHKVNTTDNFLCKNIACDRKSAKVVGRYSREFDRRVSNVK